MARQSAGVLLHRRAPAPAGGLEVLLVHPGGPFFARKDAGAWSIPKGELSEGEAPLDAARRELQEETAVVATGPFLPLQPVKQKGGKLVHAFACEQDAAAQIDLSRCTTFELEWPPRSGRVQRFPEVDRAEYFELGVARSKINAAQVALLDELQARLDSGAPAHSRATGSGPQ